MNLPEAEQDFLRDLVKSSRQRPHHIRWVDRDGSDRITTLSQTDAARFNAIAQKLGVSKDAVLRQAAHLPVARRPVEDNKSQPD
jgi:hypothetical protein